MYCFRKNKKEQYDCRRNTRKTTIYYFSVRYNFVRTNAFADCGLAVATYKTPRRGPMNLLAILNEAERQKINRFPSNRVLLPQPFRPGNKTDVFFYTSTLYYENYLDRQSFDCGGNTMKLALSLCATGT